MPAAGVERAQYVEEPADLCSAGASVAGFVSAGFETDAAGFDFDDLAVLDLVDLPDLVVLDLVVFDLLLLVVFDDFDDFADADLAGLAAAYSLAGSAGVVAVIAGSVCSELGCWSAANTQAGPSAIAPNMTK